MKRADRGVNIPIWRSIQMKFVVSYLVLIVSVLAVLNSYPIFTSQDMVFRSKQTVLQNQAAIISSAVSALGDLTAEGVGQVMDMLDASSLTRVIITNEEGLILYDTEQGEHLTQKYALLQELSRALGGKDVFVSSYRGGAFRSAAAEPVMYRNAVIGAVYLYEFDSEAGAIITGLQHTLLKISLVLLVLAILLSYVLSLTMTRRISRLISGIGHLREGEYSTRVKVSGRDELATLATAFNDMTERLQATDEVRKRFVSDASHELKTPLASIKLLADSIAQNEDMDVETIREFVLDIGTEADRLTRITEELLALTRMDNSGGPARQDVDLADVISDALHMLTPLADRRSISIHLVMEQGCVVSSSPDEMYQVLFNLVENAIKYNVEGGEIWIRARRDGSSAVVSVEDTGIGIPREDRDKIFDRFYRVDKARSREAGGTGLGLSIVRDTVVKNAGAVRADARPGGGTVFVVTLPLALQGKEART